MINSDPPTTGDRAAEDDAVRSIVASGAGGAVALAGITTAIVIAIWFVFYLFVFFPRATVP
jgi:hypothetical protein